MPEATPPTRVLLLSAVGTRINPYLDLLREGLTRAGATTRLAAAWRPDDWSPGRPDVIHLHWLERYDLPPALTLHVARAAATVPRRALRRGVELVANSPGVYVLRRWARLRRLFNQLRRFQMAGGRVIYTVHNLDPHEDASSIERWGVARLMHLADVVHVHDASTAEAVAVRFGRRRGVVVVSHGHYANSYPNTINRTEARQRLDLPEDAYVFVCLGLLRPYKGLEELLPAFRSLTTAGAPDCRLVLAGQPGSEAYLRDLTTLAAGDVRIRFLPGFVPPEEVQVYLNAADAAVLPYRQITTSGAALLALSFGLPVIAPALGAFPHLLAEPDARRGILYDPADPGALARALNLARGADWTGVRDEIKAWVMQFDWGEVGRKLLAAYMS